MTDPANNTIHYKITVTGHVQGVGYRWFTKNNALKLGLKGFCRNNYDGSVYIEAEGKKTAIELFIKMCYEGPELAVVKEIHKEIGEPNNYTHFEIRH